MWECIKTIYLMKMYSYSSMYDIRPPSQLVLEAGPAGHAEAWREWYSQFTIFLKASGAIRGGSNVKSSLLLELIGPKGYDIFSSFVFDKEEDSRDFEKVIKKFNEYFHTKREQRNSTISRYNFFTRNQESGESIDDYVTVLRLWAEQCQFEHLEDGLIKDRIVCGVLNDNLRDILLGTEELTLEEAVKICQAHESPKLEAQNEADEVDELDATSSGVFNTYDSHASQTARRFQARRSF